MTKRIGVYGGSFDPVHFGHLLPADLCVETLDLDTFYFVPAAQSPLKKDGPVAPDEHRVKMLEIAVNGTNMQVDTTEIDRGGISYTVDTLGHMKEIHPDSELFFLMGADLMPQLDQWQSPETIFELARPVVAARGGYQLDLKQLHRFAPADTTPIVLSIPQIELSSSEIRDRVRSHRSIRYRTPDHVVQYINQHSLYR